MLNRKLATAAVGAVAAGTLLFSSLSTAAVAAGPVAGINASVAAAATTVEFGCNAFGSTMAYDAGDAVDVVRDGDNVTVTWDLKNMAGIVPVALTDYTFDVTANLTVNGQDVAATGSVTQSVAARAEIPLPDVSASVTTDAAETTVVVTSLTIKAGAMSIPCTLPSPVTLGAFDTTVPEAPPAEAAFDCTYQAWTLPYDPTVAVTQDGKDVSVAMSAFPGIDGVPPFVTLSKVVAKATITVAGKAVELSGEQVIDPATPMADGFAVPALTGSLPAGVPAGAAVVSGLGFTVTSLGSEHSIGCEGTTSVDLAATPEDPKPETPAPAAKVKANLKNVKANYAKKKKVLTVKAAVKGSKGTATGQVKIQIKKGKKTVRTVTVKLNKKGAFNKKIKKIKGKGKFKVVIQYQGDKNYKTAKATKQFRA